MRLDAISLLAKKDPLICAFGARYIKVHRENHFINVASRKMRELSRLLMEVRKHEPSIKNLFQVLKPQFFDILVASTKAVAHYDQQNDRYKSPTYALNISTSLKQCCDIAVVYALKRKHVFGSVSGAEAESDLKSLVQLIDSHWRYEVSTQAASDLAMHKWNKVTIVPLAADLKLLKEYLMKTASKAVVGLTRDKSDLNNYTILLETVFCRVMLLNRRRPGELQRLPLYLYENSDDTNSQKYEEFANVVTPSEKILLQKFKRIVIRGKRGRGVPVLFSDDVQDHVKILLRHRNIFVNKSNIYLFGNPKSDEPICGYKILKKYATACGAKNPQAITATKLRKHLATLTQLFTMSESDLEQLAGFMGHTIGVHRGSYRLPDDVYQTAKISKLLMLMEKGGAAEFAGKSLQEIEINLNDDLMEEDIDDAAKENYTPDQLREQEHSSPIENGEISGEQKTTFRKAVRKLTPWTAEQKNIVKAHFADHIKHKRPPKKQECFLLKEQHNNLLLNKDWLKIKVFVQNEYTKKGKK